MKKFLFALCLLPFLGYAQPGYVRTIAGSGTSTTDGIPATSAYLNMLHGICVDGSGNIYFSETLSGGAIRIKKIDAATGNLYVIAGSGTVAGYSGDGGPATAAVLSNVPHISVDAAQNIYLADYYSTYHVRKIDHSSGIISLVAGGGSSTTDGTPATGAALNGNSLTVDAAGNVYTYSNARIKRISAATGLITTFAGGGSSSADGIPATNASITTMPAGMRIDANGNLLFLNFSGSLLRKVDAHTGIITTLAGGGSSTADSIPATSYALSNYLDLTLDPHGNIFLLRGTYPEALMKIDATTGIIKKVGGGGTLTADGISLMITMMQSYTYLCSDNFGNIILADQNHRVRVANSFDRTISGGVGCDSFRAIVNDKCSGPEIAVMTLNYYAGMSVKTYFGDGATATTAVSSAMLGGGYAAMSHSYANSGTYTIKQILFVGATAVDSVVYSYVYAACNTFRLKLYYDGNSNCTQDSGDVTLSLPTLISIDSNGITIDTISSASGLYYNAYGSAGDVYAFRVIAAPTAFHVTCPSTGIVYDTLSSTVFTTAPKSIAMECGTSSVFDLRILTSVATTGINDQTGHIFVENQYCAPTAGTVTLHFSPKYPSLRYAMPAPASVTGNTATWNLGAISSTDGAPHGIYYCVGVTGASLTIGDTVRSSYSVSPVSGDADASNNNDNSTDTIRAACDPNNIAVSPAGCIASGAGPTELQYTINFENTGNDTAHNIYVMDTLPDYVDVNSMRVVLASHEMYVSKMKWGVHNLLKFDFPNINLLDSSRHGFCDGTVIYTINTKPGLTLGTDIMNRAGIYFDVNAVVMTNEAHNVIGCPVASVTSPIPSEGVVTVYPNPASDLLNINADSQVYESYTITNSVGGTVLNNTINSSISQVNIKALPAGLYFVNLKGAGGNIVKKFVKM